jgi:hypothetical protein
MVMLAPAYSMGISSKPSPLSGDSLVMRIVPLLSASFTPPVRSLAAIDTARSASANARAGNANELLALLRNDLRVRRKLRVDQAHRERHPAALKERARPALRDLKLRARVRPCGLLRLRHDVVAETSKLLDGLERESASSPTPAGP